MEAIAIALFALCALVTASRRFLTRVTSRIVAMVWQVLTLAGGVAVLMVEHARLSTLPWTVVMAAFAVVCTVLLDAVGVTRMIAKSLGG